MNSHLDELSTFDADRENVSEENDDALGKQLLFLGPLVQLLNAVELERKSLGGHQPPSTLCFCS